MREARFGLGKATIPGMQDTITTEEALQLIEEQKRKKQERVERFGIVTEEINEKRVKDRQERFGTETKDLIDTKKQERTNRFSMMEVNS